MHEWNELSERRLGLDELKIKEGYTIEETKVDLNYGKPVTRIEKVGPASRSQK